MNDQSRYERAIVSLSDRLSLHRDRKQPASSAKHAASTTAALRGKDVDSGSDDALSDSQSSNDFAMADLHQRMPVFHM